MANTNLKDKVGNIIRQWEGPLTRQLLLKPGEFGLGKIPDRLKPDSTTTVVCGFCSTGCGLNVHMKDGEAVNLTPATDYPVNLGMACPKGWEAIAPLKANDRATVPYRRSSSGKLIQTSWDSAMNRWLKALKKFSPSTVMKQSPF